jgi:hypothetical protein
MILLFACDNAQFLMRTRKYGFDISVRNDSSLNSQSVSQKQNQCAEQVQRPQFYQQETIQALRRDEKKRNSLSKSVQWGLCELHRHGRLCSQIEMLLFQLSSSLLLTTAIVLTGLLHEKLMLDY